MNDAWLIGIIALETTIIGFFVRVHWLDFVDLKRKVDALMTDKALRDKQNNP